MKVSIVIPNWNGEEKLKKNLPSVLKVKSVEEIIVVDDASSDNSVEILEREFPQVKLIKKNKNSGFSSTVNLGVKNSSCSLVFLLNSDALAKEDCVEKVLDHTKDPKVFSVGFNAGGSWAWGYFKDGYFWHGQARETPKEVHQTLWVSGGSGLFKKSIWDELGGLDELFDPFYEEDVDLGYRATKRGYTNLWAPNAKVEHYRQKGVIEENFPKSFVSRIAQRNQLIFIWKNITDSELIKQHIFTLVKMLVTHPKYWPIFLSALVRLPEILRKRRMEMKRNKYLDKEILSRFRLAS